MPHKTYRLDRVLVAGGEQRPATWTFGGTAVTGTERSYTVTDTNFPSRNQWEFIVRLPSVASERIEVRPRSTPPVKVWAELPDRSLTFMPATLGSARGKRYCQVALADSTGEKSRRIVTSDQRNELPRWFADLKGRVRTKEHVKRTRGTDGKALVVVIPADDFAFMIRLFFVMKVWVLQERFALSTG